MRNKTQHLFFGVWVILLSIDFSDSFLKIFILIVYVCLCVYVHSDARVLDIFGAGVIATCNLYNMGARNWAQSLCKIRIEIVIKIKWYCHQKTYRLAEQKQNTQILVYVATSSDSW